nr:hypothetical protein Iba_chr10dCG13580 [Ipomoea batatas]
MEQRRRQSARTNVSSSDVVSPAMTIFEARTVAASFGFDISAVRARAVATSFGEEHRQHSSATSATASSMVDEAIETAPSAVLRFNHKEVAFSKTMAFEIPGNLHSSEEIAKDGETSTNQEIVGFVI